MKRFIILLLIVTVFFGVAKAQTIDSARKQYLEWKKQTLTTLQSSDHLYTYRVAIALKRLDNKRARVLVAAVGRSSNYYFSLLPIQTVQFFDAESELEKAGQPKEWGAGQDTSVPRLGYLLDFAETIDIDENANAFLVNVRPTPNMGQAAETIVVKFIVPINKDWYFEEKTEYVPFVPSN